MKNIIEILNKSYKSLNNAKRSQDFFFYLADYVNYIKKTPETNRIIKTELKKKETILKERDKYEAKTLEELETAKQELLRIVKQNQISNPEISQQIKELKWYENGRIQSSGVLLRICLTKN